MTAQGTKERYEIKLKWLILLFGDYDKITQRHWLMFPHAPGTNYQDKETVRCHIHWASIAIRILNPQ